MITAYEARQKAISVLSADNPKYQRFFEWVDVKAQSGKLVGNYILLWSDAFVDDELEFLGSLGYDIEEIEFSHPDNFVYYKVSWKN